MRGTPQKFSNFTPGLNTAQDPVQLQPGEARDLLNVQTTTRGAIVKRDGLQLFATPASVLTSLVANEATSDKGLIGVGGNHIYKIGATGTASDLTGSNTVTNNRWETLSAAIAGSNGPVFMMNGVDTPLSWTGSGSLVPWTASSGTIPNGKFLKYHGNRVWVAGLQTDAAAIDPQSTLRFSNIGNPQDWPAQNYVQFDPHDGDQITGIGTVGPMLLVFKNRKAWVVYNLDTGANRRLGDNIGCPAHRTIVETPNGTFFLTLDKGVYVTNGTQLQRISNSITPTLEGIVASQRQYAAAAFHNDHYYLSYCDDANNLNNKTLDYDAVAQSWWKHDFAANQFAVWRNPYQPHLYAANPASAKISDCLVDGITQDNGTNFAWQWTGPWHDFGNPYLKKRVRQMAFDGSGSVDFYVGTDYTSTLTLNKSLLFGSPSAAAGTLFAGANNFAGTGIFGDPQTGASQQAGVRAYTLGVGRVWSIKFAATSSLPGLIDSYTFALTPRKN